MFAEKYFFLFSIFVVCAVPLQLFTMKLICELLFYYKACAVGVRKHDLNRCDEIYTELGTRIFSKLEDRQEGETSWKDRLITCTEMGSRSGGCPRIET